MERLTPDRHFWYDQMIKKGFAEKDETYLSVYYNGNPSEIFKQTLLAAGGEKARLIDIGCGPGKYTGMFAPGYQTVIGLDRSGHSLNYGRTHRAVPNMYFVLGDSAALPFENESFETASTRLSPHSLAEIMRVLKPNGQALCMRVGEYDAFRLREMFGQEALVAKMGGYIARSEPHSKHIVEEWKQTGFIDVTSSEHRYDMHCETLDDLAKYLSRIPIVPEFDMSNSEHMKKLQEYAAESIHPDSGAITLHRHRYIIKGQKSNR